MVICCDTSFLFSLYGNDSNSPAALAWLKGSKGPLSLTRLNEFELFNALRFAVFRKAYPADFAAQCQADFEADIGNGRLVVLPWNLAAVVATAHRLSESHTIHGGHRSFDILHVAAAIELQAVTFLTFDENQRKLAEAENLLVPW